MRELHPSPCSVFLDEGAIQELRVNEGQPFLRARENCLEKKSQEVDKFIKLTSFYSPLSAILSSSFFLRFYWYIYILFY
jgi:hypothetical protein